jgi:thiol:disulfide interchange protein DsbD
MQVHNFNINAQPYYILLDHNGNLLTTPRAYDLDIDAFYNFLKTGLENFKAGEHF